MSLYSYKKKITKLDNPVIQSLSQLFLITGLLVLFWSVFPIASYQVQYLVTTWFTPKVPLALSKEEVTTGNPTTLGAFNTYSTNLNDFTSASLWFPTLKFIKKEEISTILPANYTLSIPKINVYDALVNVGGEDLNQGLIHYQPVVGPGTIGNVAIFGHSTLPQLFKNKDYKSIFTYLPSVERGDEVTVSSENKQYTYVVEEMFVVKPDQISILDQKQDGSYLTLVTCVPPGTYWNRLVVRAKLKLI
jgi:sortase A